MFSPRPSRKSRGCGEGATILQAMGMEGTTKLWRVFVDKSKARLAPGSVQLYSALVYSSKGDLYMNC